MTRILLIFVCFIVSIIFHYPSTSSAASTIPIRYVSTGQGSGFAIGTGGTSPRRVPITTPQRDTLPRNTRTVQNPAGMSGASQLNMDAITKAYVDKAIRELLAKIAGRCPAGKFVVGFSTDGAKICEAPPSNIPNNSTNSSIMSGCPDGQFMVGFTANGHIQCGDDPMSGAGNTSQSSSGSNTNPWSNMSGQGIGGVGNAFDFNGFMLDGKEYEVAYGTESYSWNNAVSYCNDLTEGSSSDWKLPNISELMQMYENRDFLLGFGDNEHWSSTTNSQGRAWYKSFNDEGQSGYVAKNLVKKVRCVRVR